MKVVIMKEIMSWLLKRPIVTVARINFDFDYLILGPFHFAKLENIPYSRSTVVRTCHLGSHMVHFPQTRFLFGKAINTISMYLLEKNCWSRSRVMRMSHFWVQNGPFSQNKNFCGKIINITSIYPWRKILTKFLQRIPGLWGCAIFGPKMVFLPTRGFFLENPLTNLVPFIHAYLCYKNQIQISIY